MHAMIDCKKCIESAVRTGTHVKLVVFTLEIFAVQPLKPNKWHNFYSFNEIFHNFPLLPDVMITKRILANSFERHFQLNQNKPTNLASKSCSAL